MIVNLDGNKLTWNFYKEDEDKDEGYKYIVSAETGEVLKKYNDPIISLNIKSSGKNLNNQDVEFNTLKSKDNKYFMIDIERNIFLYDIAKEKRKINFNNEKIFNRTLNTFVNSKLFTNNDGIWNDKTANSLISNISYVYDYYENNLNRKSPNGNDSQIYVYAHWSKKNSAISLTSNDKKYTWLLFSEEAPAAKALDVVAHEYTHSVIANTANLIYKNETGALNEAYADILGNLIENHDDPNWRLGEDMFDGKKEFRNMSNPQFNKQPEHYNNFIKTRDDNGGVHINSGIVNKAFYLMWKNGLTNKQMLAKLWYRSLNYLWANSLFVDCRNAIIASANDMCLNQNQIAIIKEAFDNVGIHSNQYTSTANLQNGGILTGQGDTIYYAVNGTAYSHIFSKKEGEEPKHLLEDNENQGAIKDLNIVGDYLYYKQGTTLDDNCLWGNYKIYEFNLKTNERKIIEEDGDYPIATSSGLYYLRKSGNYPKSERFLDSSGKVLSEKNYQMVRSEYELSDLIFYSFSDKNKKVIKSGIYTLALDNDRIVYGILEKYVMAAMGVPTVTYYFLSDNSKSPTNARLAYMESFTVGQFTYSYGNKGYKRSDKNGNSSMEIGNFREGWFNNAYYPINNYVYYNQDIFFACFDDNNIYRCDYSKGTKDLVYSTDEVECGKHMAIYNGKLYTIIKGQLIEITKI